MKKLKTKYKKMVIPSILIVAAAILILSMFAVPGKPLINYIDKGLNISSPAVTIAKTGEGEKIIGAVWINENKAKCSIITKLMRAPLFYDLGENAITCDIDSNQAWACIAWIEKVGGDEEIQIQVPKFTVGTGGTGTVAMGQGTPGGWEIEEDVVSAPGASYKLYYKAIRIDGDKPQPLEAKEIDTMEYFVDPLNLCVSVKENDIVALVYPNDNSEGVKMKTLNVADGEVLHTGIIPVQQEAPFKLSALIIGEDENDLIIAMEKPQNKRIVLYGVDLSALDLVGELEVDAVKAVSPELIETDNLEICLVSYVSGNCLCYREIHLDDVIPGDLYNMYQTSDDDNDDETCLCQNPVTFSGDGSEDLHTISYLKYHRIFVVNLPDKTIGVIPAYKAKKEMDNSVLFNDYNNIEHYAVLYIRKTGNIEKLYLAQIEI